MNCVFINGVWFWYFFWGGFLLWMDVVCDNVVMENNLVVNFGCLLVNSGFFYNVSV